MLLLSFCSAPNNEAFENLFEDLNTTSLSEDQLTSVLTYHVIAGVVLSSDELIAQVPSSIVTVNGASVKTGLD